MITAVGEALVDLVVGADDTITAMPGGAPFNVARACSRLGAPVGLVASVSTDHFGQRLMADLDADGVHTDRIQRTDLPTTLAVAALDAAGTATYRFYLQGTSAAALTTVPAVDQHTGRRGRRAGLGGRADGDRRGTHGPRRRR